MACTPPFCQIRRQATSGASVAASTSSLDASTRTAFGRTLTGCEFLCTDFLLRCLVGVVHQAKAGLLPVRQQPLGELYDVLVPHALGAPAAYGVGRLALGGIATPVQDAANLACVVVVVHHPLLGDAQVDWFSAEQAASALGFELALAECWHTASR